MADADLYLARPRQRGRPLTSEEKWLVQHVFETFAKEKNTGALVRREDPYSLTSKSTGVARSLVATIAKAVRQTGSVPISTSPGNRQQPTAIPCSTAGRIRECIFDQNRQGTIGHAKHVKALLKDAFGIEGHERTVQRHLSRMGCCGLRTKNRPRSLRERVEVRQQRHDDLYALRKNRHRSTAQRSQGVYVDESFLHHHHGGQYSWFSEHDDVERMRGKGRRGGFMHAMQEHALVDEALLACEAKKSQGDDPGQFDWEMFQRWFKEQLLPHVPSRRLIVLDRCAFHMVCRDSLVPSQMKKVDLQQWLMQRDCSRDPGFDMDRAGDHFYTTGPNHFFPREPTMFGPGAYVPDSTEGIVDVKDLPVPQLGLYSRNHKHTPCPRCGHLASRPTSDQRTLHDLGD